MADLKGTREIADRQTVQVEQDSQSVIVYNLGGAEVFAIPLFLIRHIERLPAEDIMIAKGREYFNYADEIVPLVRMEKALDAIVTDYKEDMFVIIIKGRKPVGILAAEIEDSLVIYGGLDEKSVTRHEIIGASMVEKRMILVVDVYKIIEQADPEWFNKKEGYLVTTSRILLLEDMHYYAAIISSFFKGEGIEVVHVKNGKEGLQALAKEKFDLIISDIEMPVMNGIEFAAGVRENSGYDKIPLWALSAHLDVQKIIDAGFDKYISKLNKESMFDSLKEIVEILS